MKDEPDWASTREAVWRDDAVAEPRRWPPVASAAGVALAYGAAALFSLAVGRQPGSLATIWFATAIAVAYLAFRPPARWPLPLLLLALADAAAARAFGGSWRAAFAGVPPHVVECLLGAALLRRAGLPASTLRGAAPLLRLWLLGGLLPQVVGAAVAMAMRPAAGREALALAGLQWLEGAMIGAISVLPLAFVFFRVGWASLRPVLLERRALALLPLAVAVALLALMHAPHPIVFLVLPLLLAATMVEFAAVALNTLAVSVTMALALAWGLFVPPPTTSDWSTAFVYLAYAAALVPSQLLAAALAELRDSHARLAHRSAALRRSNEALEQFVRIASHDLREPLNTVVQFGSLIEQDHAGRMPADARRYLALMLAAAQRMRTLLDDVLQYARLQGSAPEPPVPVALEALMAGVRDALAARLRASGGRLHVSRLPVVRGHPALLSLMLQNLVGNALKFVPPGRVPAVDVSAHVDGANAWVTVADNGIGIAADDLPRLFRPFQRLHLRRQFEGTGLGLALCRQVAQAHGGEIHVASVPGEGSRFTVRLPLAD